MADSVIEPWGKVSSGSCTERGQDTHSSTSSLDRLQVPNHDIHVLIRDLCISLPR
jgi:hypothetical protein